MDINDTPNFKFYREKNTFKIGRLVKTVMDERVNYYFIDDSADVNTRH